MLAKNISLRLTPLEYVEVEDIVDRKIEAKTHNYLYLVKFKNENENIWIPGHNFLDQVLYHRRKMNKDQKQFALQPLKSEVKSCVKESKISKRKQNNDCNEEIN